MVIDFSAALQKGKNGRTKKMKQCRKLQLIVSDLQSHQEENQLSKDLLSDQRRKESANIKLDTDSDWICENCFLAFDTYRLFNNHMDKNHKGSISCNECEKTFNVKRLLEKHKIVSHTVYPISCKICEIVCLIPKEYIAHMKSHNCESDEHLFCETCGNKFANQYILKTHMTRHESEIQTYKKTIFTCEECGQNLCSKKSLLRHKIAAHSRDYPFQCTICLKGFTSELRKKICEDNHNGVFKYVCTQCDFKSNQSDKFRAHMNTHSKENCYKCPCCGKISLTTKNLGLHTKQVHGKTLCEAEIFSKKDRLGRNLTDSQFMKIQLKINKQ